MQADAADRDQGLAHQRAYGLQTTQANYRFSLQLGRSREHRADRDVVDVFPARALCLLWSVRGQAEDRAVTNVLTSERYRHVSLTDVTAVPSAALEQMNSVVQQKDGLISPEYAGDRLCRSQHVVVAAGLVSILQQADARIAPRSRYFDWLESASYAAFRIEDRVQTKRRIP